MRVLIAPDSFTGTLTATQAAAAMGEGWSAGAPHDTLDLLPLGDGGPGFLDVLESATGGTTVAVVVSDPLGREVPAAVLVVDEAAAPGPATATGEGTTGPRRTAYIESAQACGLHLLAADERSPALTSTWGVGQLLAAALDEHVDRIVVGLGGSGTNDGGAGMLAALGAGPAEELARGGLALADAGDDALAGLPDVRTRLSGVEVVLATDTETPLLGLQGASATGAPALGADVSLAQALESALGRFSEIGGRALGREGERADLLTGRPRRLDKEPGAGAGGGLGYGLLLLGGRRTSAVDEVLGAVDLADRLRACDLVVTGEGCVDWASLRGSVVAGVSQAAQAQAVPVVVLAGQLLVGRRETMALGISGAYAVADGREQVEAAHLDPVGTLRARATRVARTWSPAR